MTAVGEDAAGAEPALLAAVTTTKTVEPTSEDPSMYEDVVAAAIGAQFAPPASQSYH